MSDWSKATADRFRTKAQSEQEQDERLRQEEHAKNQKAILDSNTLKLNAPQMWDDLCDLFATECEEFNQEGAGITVTSQRLDPNTLELRRDRSEMKLVFDPQRYVITVRGLEVSDTKSRTIEIKVNGEKLDYFRADSTSSTAKRIVEQCLEDFLGLS